MTISNLTRAQYDALVAVNWSSLKHLGRSPAHYQAALKQTFADTDTLRIGRAFHVAALEPQRAESLYAVWAGRRAGKEWEAFQAAAEESGREVIRDSDYQQALTLALAVRGNSTARRYLDRAGAAEQSIQWIAKSLPVSVPFVADFEPYAITCKGRLDWVTEDGWIVDLKSSRDAAPDAFGRDAARLGYVTQAAWYFDGLEAATGKRPQGYAMIAVEKSAPYVVQVYQVTDEQLELGRQTYRDLLDRLWLCTRENRWPAYAEGELPLALPRWATPSFDDEGAEDLGLTFGAGQLSES